MASNLPPGCTDRDISRAAGDYPEQCAGCLQTFMANELDEHCLCEKCASEKQEEKEQNQ